MRKILITGFLFLGMLTGMIAQEWTQELATVLNQLEKDSLFDGQVLIAEKGKILFHQAYGHSDERQKQPINKQTALPVYSVGKSFTAMAIMLLKKEGLLAYEDNVASFFPAFPYQEVSIRHLLTMTSGLPRFLETALKYGDTSVVIHNQAILELVLKHRPPAGAPGARFAYNNSNYLLLASIVEKVSGLSFATYLEEKIFQPLGMEHSYEAGARPTPLSAESINADNFYQPYGAGTVRSTVADLLKYDQALYEGKLVDREELEVAFQCVPLADRTLSNYGFGWRINNCENLEEVYHVGDGPNLRASLQRFLPQRHTLIYIHAQSNVYHEAVYQAIRNIWEGKAYELPQKRTPYVIDTALYQDYVGSYLSNFGLIHISTEAGKLFLRPDPVPGKEELVPSSDTTFYFKHQNLEWEFFLDKEKKVLGFGIKGDRKNMGLKQQ